MSALGVTDAISASQQQACIRIARRIRHALPGDAGRYLGVDTVGVSFSVADADFATDPQVWTREERGHRIIHRFRGEVDGVYTRIEVFEHLVIGEDHAHRVTAWVEVSLGRVYDPSGWSLCPAGRAHDVLAGFLAGIFVRGLVVPNCLHRTALCGSVECMLATVRFTRIDVGFDFVNLGPLKPYVEHVRQQEHPRQKGEALYSNTGLSLTTGHAYARTVRLYDKRAEALSHGRKGTAVAPAGTVRLEAEHRKSALKTAGLQRLSQLNSITLSRALRAAYRWLGLHLPLGGAGTPAERILKSAELSAARQRTLLGAMKAAELGWDRNPTSKWFRHALREHGLSLGTSLDRASGEVLHLCLQTGRESITTLDTGVHVCIQPAHQLNRAAGSPVTQPLELRSSKSLAGRQRREAGNHWRRVTQMSRPRGSASTSDGRRE